MEQYKLDLPATAKIHPLHVSQLKKRVPPEVQVSEHLPSAIDLSQESVNAVVQTVPKSRLVRKGATTHMELLV